MSFPEGGQIAVSRKHVRLVQLATVAIAVSSSLAFAQAGVGGSDVAGAQTLKRDVRRVEVDVVVTDSKGRPVRGLTQEDFKVQEDGAPQSLRSFDVHAFAATDAPAPLKVPPLPRNTFLNLPTAGDSGTPTVVLYDALNTPLTEQNDGHKELLEWMRHRRPGTPVAIFILIDKLYLLQGFTPDSGLLMAALESKRGRVQTTTLLAPAVDTSTTPTTQDESEISDAFSQTFEGFLEKVRELDGMQQSQLQDERVQITLNALTEIGRFTESLPGRKNLIWFSAGFPANILPDPTTTADVATHDQAVRNYREQIKEATDLLNLSHVSLYPVDMRGVRVNSGLSASANANFGPDPSYAGPDRSSFLISSRPRRPTTSNSLTLSQQSFILGETATRRTMDSLADATGGHAFYGTNGLQEAVESAVESGSTYYSLTYSPTNPRYDGSLRHIKVTLKKSGYNLAYRRTYYADDLGAAARAVADAPEGPLTPALERGTPLAHGLFVEAHLEADGAPVAATPEQQQVLAQYAAMQARAGKSGAAGSGAPVMMQRYLISYGLIARQVEMPVDDAGAHTASLEFGVMAYDDDGRKLSGVDTHIDDAIPEARYGKVASDGYHVAQEVAVPVTATSLRLAVRDVKGNRVGSLEVKLPLAAAPHP